MNRILLLEDDVSLIDGLVYSLKKNEFDVEVARTVCEAKQYLSELDRYDLLILDVTLPDGTGFDVCERVRKENQQIPIIILSMLKITRLDTGNIIFEKKSCRVSELIAHSVNDLTTRAKSESKQIQIDGDGEQQLICDMEWTGEAIGNIVKNALDHTQAGGIVRITWERTPAMFRIFISDNGNGIVPEDIYHIFKRFYRSKHSLDTQGIGLGLPLAKSIIEGQNGVISVQSEVGKGTLFTLSFLTDL